MKIGYQAGLKLLRCGAQLIVTISASPWEQGKIEFREAMIADAARRHGVPFVFCNLVGGNDELIFDGSSSLIDERGRIVRRLASFSEDFALVEPFAQHAVEAPALPDSGALLEDACPRYERVFLVFNRYGGHEASWRRGYGDMVTDLALGRLAPYPEVEAEEARFVDGTVFRLHCRR